jgi:transposase
MVNTTDQWLSMLVNRMREHLLKQVILHADETTLRGMARACKYAT